MRSDVKMARTAALKLLAARREKNQCMDCGTPLPLIDEAKVLAGVAVSAAEYTLLRCPPCHALFYTQRRADREVAGYKQITPAHQTPALPAMDNLPVDPFEAQPMPLLPGPDDRPGEDVPPPPPVLCDPPSGSVESAPPTPHTIPPLGPLLPPGLPVDEP